MQRIINYFRHAAVAACAACALASCVCEDLAEEDMPGSGDQTLLSVGLQLPALRAAAEGTGSYEPGDENENYIDIRNKGYRLYFFDTADKYVGRFVPFSLTPAGEGTRYEALGVAPNGLSKLTDFKVVVAANWPVYPDESLVAGTSTIADLCNAGTAQFDRLTSFELDPAKGLTIPFYGVHEYKGVKFKKGERTTLTEPVTLLRAMAKVELIVDIAGVSLVDVGLRGYNARGYCAPKEVFTQTDYDHGGQWELDYVKAPHLIGDANDAGQGEGSIPLFRKQEADEATGQKETWIAYVPEYRNTGLAPDGTENYKARLDFKLDIQEEDELPYHIYFAKYEKTEMVADSYFDILRNNCYRFTVTIDHGGLVIKVKKWDNTYDYEYSFD